MWIEERSVTLFFFFFNETTIFVRVNERIVCVCPRESKTRIKSLMTYHPH